MFCLIEGRHVHPSTLYSGGIGTPVVSRAGPVIGGLFFGHPQADVFAEHAERMVLGIAAQAAVAIDNARMYTEAKQEIAKRSEVEEALKKSEASLKDADRRTDDLLDVSRISLGKIELRKVIVSVKDDGIGIEREMLGTVFEMFTQVDRSLDKSQGGLGIGLNITKKLVEMHGGTIKAESAGTGRGSEFIVRLPCVHSRFVFSVPGL
jgi:GAF domain-containing protein